MTILAKQEQAFSEPPATVGKLTLRPLTAGTLLLLKQTKNPLLAGGITGDDTEFHIAAFLFIHSADSKLVRKAALSDSTFRDAVLEFADGLSISDFASATKQIKTICEQSVVGMTYQVEESKTGENPNE